MEVEIKITENETFIEQEEKFLKGLLEKYRSENPKEEINLEESDIKIYSNIEYRVEFFGKISAKNRVWWLTLTKKSITM